MVYGKNSSELKERFKREVIALLKPRYEKFKGQSICIYGDSIYGRTIKRILEEIDIQAEIKCFINSFHDDSVATIVDDISELSPELALNKYNDAQIVIASDYSLEIKQTIKKIKGNIDNVIDVSSVAYGGIYEKMLRYYYFGKSDFTSEMDVVGDIQDWFNYYGQIKQNGQFSLLEKELLDYFDDSVSKETFKSITDFYLTGNIQKLIDSRASTPQYYSKDYFDISENETFIDCGAYNGDTVSAFIRYSQNKFKKIIAIEPDVNNFKKLKENVKAENIDVINAVVADSCGYASFNLTGGRGARISDSSGVFKIKQIDLDSLSNEHPSFIKMDIEGAEISALKGAQKIIREYKPKLAICVYHRPQDLFEIPLFVKKLNPDYKIKLRKHTNGPLESVLYAYT